MPPYVDNRLRLWAALIATVTAYAFLLRPADRRLTDLGVYLGAVTDLRHGDGLYDFIRDGAPFTYPPFAALVFLPLTFLPTLAVQIAWTLGTVAAVYAIARQANAPLAALAVFLSAPVSSDLRLGQVSLFLALMILSRKPVLIGLAAAIKLTPLIFIPLLWLRGERRPAVIATATFAAGGFLAALVLPGDSLRYWLTEVRDVDRIGVIESPGNQSLNAGLLRLGVPDTPRAAITLLLGGAIVLLALKQARRQDWLAATVIVGAASVVFSPVSWTHHQIWLVLAAFVPLRHEAWRWVVLAVMLLPSTAVWNDARLALAIAIAVGLVIQDDDENAASKAADGASNASRRTNCSASGAPTSRSMPASSHSIEIGPS
jgi:alpha-1,2-mannosyltransferase